jgi:hypothetical protein
MARPGLEPGTPRFSGVLRPFRAVALITDARQYWGFWAPGTLTDCRRVPPRVRRLLARLPATVELMLGPLSRVAEEELVYNRRTNELDQRRATISAKLKRRSYVDQHFDLPPNTPIRGDNHTPGGGLLTGADAES